jgi:uncharacterized RDD family membrane protein YckC
MGGLHAAFILIISLLTTILFISMGFAWKGLGMAFFVLSYFAVEVFYYVELEITGRGGA